MVDKKTRSIGAFIFLSIAVFLTVYVVGQNQDIRQRASSGSGTITISMVPVGTSFFVGEIIPIKVLLQLTSTPISGIQIFINGNSDDFDFVTSTGASLTADIDYITGTDHVFYVNTSTIPSQTSWSYSFNKYSISGTTTTLKFSEFDIRTTVENISGTPIVGTFYIKPKRVPSGGQLTITYDALNTAIIHKVTAEDILFTPSPLSFTIQSDTTPPTPPVVTDDGNYTSVITQLHALWSASDAESGIIEYQYAIGTDTNTNIASVVNWTPTGMTTDITKTGLSLTSGTTYYFSVKTKNRVGLWSTIESSNGIRVDNTGSITPAVIDDGTTTTAVSQLHASWSASDAESGIVEYQYAIGTDTGTNIANVVPWTPTGTNSSVTKTGLSLTAGPTYYISVKAKNGAGLWSNVGSSDGITVVATSLSFGVKLQGINISGVSKKLTVTLRNGTNTYPFDVTLISNSSGIFSPTAPLTLTGVPTGQLYEILIVDKTQLGTTSRRNHLQKNMTKNSDGTLSPMLISVGANSVPTTIWTTDLAKLVLGGDVNGDNKISMADVVLIINLYNDAQIPIIDNMDPLIDTRNRDIDSNGVIEMRDIALTLANYTRASVDGDN